MTTQISVDGFDRDSTSTEVAKFLEETIGPVRQLKLKKSCTPAMFYPEFQIERNVRNIRVPTTKAYPRAFVHFGDYSSAQTAFDISQQNQLVYKEKILRVSLRTNTTTQHILRNVKFEIGILSKGKEFIAAWKAHLGVQFGVDETEGSCKLVFKKDLNFIRKSDDGQVLTCMIKSEIKVDFSAGIISEIKLYKDGPYSVIIIELSASPLLFYRTADDDTYMSTDALLDDDDPWIRTTDFTDNESFNRSTSVRIVVAPREEILLGIALKSLGRFSVMATEVEHIRVRDETISSTSLSIESNVNDISFQILYLVNCLVQKGILNRYQLTEDFFKILREHELDISSEALKKIYLSNTKLIDACKELYNIQSMLIGNCRLKKSTKTLDDNVEVRKLVITPTKSYCLLPEHERSNRVLRHFKSISDRFLRVQFMDEGMETMNIGALKFQICSINRKSHRPYYISQNTNLLERVRSYLKKGITICGRTYSLLTYSPNQMKDHSVWFFAELENTTVRDIKSWMGRFDSRNVSKCIARMGLCFSSTLETIEIPLQRVNLYAPDIKRNGYIFSDGIGTMTHELSLDIAKKLKLESSPCAYQIRYGGCKGVIASWTGNDTYRMMLRTSMVKFHSSHTMLEVCNWNKYQPAFLNRQIVILLSTLGIEKKRFLDLQMDMILEMNDIFVNRDAAYEAVMTSHIQEKEAVLAMLRARVCPQDEPELARMLKCVRAAKLRVIIEKARILVPKGRVLMGCLDELQVLEQGQCFIKVSTPKSNSTSDFEVIKGKVVVTKNPCLHPGDIRVLEAVDIPNLEHMIDCLVFPQKGERPHPNEISGSDLDGDMYFVTWDESLVPKKTVEPAKYDMQKPVEMARKVEKKDLVDLFAKGMINVSLGQICNAHMVHADISEKGANDEKCIRLAELAAIAVDSPKTGIEVTMPRDLKPTLYPDFMEKPPNQTYKSSSVLGELYRSAKDSFGEKSTGKSY